MVFDLVIAYEEGSPLGNEESVQFENVQLIRIE